MKAQGIRYFNDSSIAAILLRRQYPSPISAQLLTRSIIVITTITGFSSVFIVIDALDECPAVDRERHKLLGSLRRIITAMPVNLHVFCTSRAEPDISAVISAILSPPSRAAIDLTTEQLGVNLDISLYIDSVLASHDYSSWPESLKAKAKDLLIMKADGM